MRGACGRRWVVRAYLEVERGHRDVRMLRPFLAPHLYFASSVPRGGSGQSPLPLVRWGAPNSIVSALARGTPWSSSATSADAGGPSCWCCDEPRQGMAGGGDVPSPRAFGHVARETGRARR
jgi:hypothetical protein